ncbi:MAG TPA: Ig-like domain-containing protein [Chitinophagaceae bacterium]|nr:Ig-like domain-containing protein [Chitinophagaceae bacterium]
MKKNQSLNKVLFSLLGVMILIGIGCQKRDVAELQPPSFPTTAEVFIDDFTGDLAYAAFGGSDVKAFQVDKQVTYGGTRQSMRFEVPDANSPNGSYAGGVFLSKSGRNLSGYNAITFYIKASQAATIGSLGFGNDFGANKYLVTMSNLPVTSNWKKVIIPIPDASKLTAEKGMFWYSTGPENNRGYTFWIDEVRFEKLTDLGRGTATILNGVDKTQVSYTGVTNTIDGYSATYNMPNGVNSTIGLTPYYFKFSSSNSSVASVSENGVVTTISAGTTKITAKLDTINAAGSLTLNAAGNYVGAPVPTKDPANVTSVFSDAYTNINVDYYNGYWQPFQTTQSADFQVGNDRVLNYTNFNFVGIQVTSPTVNIGNRSNLHLDLYFPDNINPGAVFKVRVLDFGANGAPGGGDDVSDIVTLTNPALTARTWLSFDIPFSSLPGLSTKGHFGQIIMEGANISNFFADNIYFWSNPVVPPVAAPVPTRPAANVLSVFSDTYTNLSGSDFFPNWGQSTVVTQLPIGGNNTLRYSNFNYQGLQLAANQNLSSYQFLHIDYYSANAGTLNAFLISPPGSPGGQAPWEKAFSLSVPTAGWNSIDIPLSHFTPQVALSSVFQFKFDGGTGSDIFLDNIYFWRIPPVPTVAAPVPTYPAGNVISIFSDSYTNISGVNLNPNWGQSTVVTQTSIVGNNTLVYTGLNYQGLDFSANPQNVSGKTFLHLDYYSANSTALNVYLICPPGSPGGQAPWEKAYTLTVPTAAGWNSVDIPLTNFTPQVALNNVFQLKFDGNGTIYLDNILFR